MPGMPTPGSAYPSPEWALAFAQYDLNDAWISDDQSKLQRVYAGVGGGSTRGDNNATHYNKGDGTLRAGGLRGILTRMFNGKIVPQSEQRTRMHAPVASNLATLSADLLMAEPPTFRLLNSKGESYKGRATERLDDILNSAAMHRSLSHGAELAAGLSATVLTAKWDREISDHPWSEPVPCDAAIPEFTAGRLVAVNLYTTHVVETGPISDEVYIHVERHEPGAIVHALFRTKIVTNVFGFGGIGANVPLDAIDATRHIPGIRGAIAQQYPETPHAVVLPTGIRSLTASWWRNLPTKQYRKVLPMMGRADFEGIEILLDAVDETWSSWMRDIKIGRARLIVPEQFLELQGAGMGGTFDDDREILTALNFIDLGPEKQPISAHQFEIRAEQHAATILGLLREITQGAGYSLSSYGDRTDGGSGITATEVSDRRTLTERTRDKKGLYFDEAADPHGIALLELDQVHYGGAGFPNDATLDIAHTELSQIDPEKQARQFSFLRAAQAVSTDTLVRMRDPQLEEVEVRREVARIYLESGFGAEIDPGVEGRVDPNADPNATDSGDQVQNGGEGGDGPSDAEE